MYRSVLFDLGNVLVRFDPVHFWDVLGIEDEGRQNQIKPLMLDLGKVYESGEIGTAEFRRRFRDLFDGTYSADKLNEAFLSVLPEPIRGMEDIVKRVAKRHEVALVSNTNPIHFDLCLRTIPALKHFERFYVSYELRAMKPDERFFAGVARGEGFPQGEMVFIDDLEPNVEAAEHAGFAAIQFTGTEQLERRLAAMTIL